MGDRFYAAVRLVGRHPFWVSSSPTVLGVEHARSAGAFIVASTHSSPFDVPVIMRHVRRHVDFVSIREVFENRFVATFYGGMNAFPLDRSRADLATVRTILSRLERGRVVGFFPEGRFCRGDASVVVSRKIRPGLGRIAKIAHVPIVPCAIVGAEVYARPTSWLPLRRVRYGIAFGEAIAPEGSSESIEERWIDAVIVLNRQLKDRGCGR